MCVLPTTWHTPRVHHISRWPESNRRMRQCNCQYSDARERQTVGMRHRQPELLCSTIVLCHMHSSKQTAQTERWVRVIRCVRPGIDQTEGDARPHKTRLFHYDPTRPITLAANASSYGVGAVITQCAPDGTKEPIGFAFKTLTTTYNNYNQVNKEALSIIMR